MQISITMSYTKLSHARNMQYIQFHENVKDKGVCIQSERLRDSTFSCVLYRRCDGWPSLPIFLRSSVIQPSVLLFQPKEQSSRHCSKAAQTATLFAYSLCVCNLKKIGADVISIALHTHELGRDGRPVTALPYHYCRRTAATAAASIDATGDVAAPPHTAVSDPRNIWKWKGKDQPRSIHRFMLYTHSPCITHPTAPLERRLSQHELGSSWPSTNERHEFEEGER